MLILGIRTDKPESEIGLFDGQNKLVYETWEAHRQLAETIHAKIKSLLDAQHKDWHDLQGIVCFKGPGSFTGLRIGLSVGNALASDLAVPIVTSSGDDWLRTGIQKLLDNQNETIALPDYGREARITTPKK